MTFTTKDKQRLAEARETVRALEGKEESAMQAALNKLAQCGLVVREDYHEADIFTHADAIRDALEPFDSGVRVRSGEVSQ